jgi:type II secretory pathway pseudopilin PulG
VAVARARGFTYIGLLIAVAIIAVAAAAALQIGAVAQRRAAEDELLGIGLEFKAAIRSYFETTPVGMPTGAPRRLEDLLRDPRFPGVKRHLRKIYSDPLTGSNDWGIVRSDDGGILGVYSKAQGVPIRQENFPDEFFHFKHGQSYKRWVFVYGVVCTDAGCELPNDEDKPQQNAAQPNLTQPNFMQPSSPQAQP